MMAEAARELVRDVRRVAVISYHSSPLTEPGSGDAGGMTVYVRQLAAALAGAGVRTDIFTRAAQGSRRIVELGPGVRVVSIDAGPPALVPKEELTGFTGDFFDGVRAFSAAQRISYDVVHSHYWQGGLVGQSLAAAWGVPFVHSHHTLGLVKNRYLAPGDDPESQARLEAEAAIIEAADVLVASTDDEQRQLACFYGARHDALKTIHPGVDHSVFAPGSRREARAQLGIGAEPVVLYVGRIQRLKGIDLGLRAFAEARARIGGEATFVIVGGASGRAGELEVERLHSLSRELGVSDHVRFEGPQPHHRLPTYYRAADVVAVCSHSESFGLAALEAQACGLPVVGTAVGGLSHIVHEGMSGFLVGTRDHSVFADRLVQLLSDGTMRESFGAAAAASAARFSWETAAGSFLELYECLVKEDAPEVCTC